ncbi:MAG: hypothetical protein M3128_13395 [Verrucomicrobiota bacterium]|nr:hypothetical protein [Verrucomicrobiota bacterium]
MVTDSAAKRLGHEPRDINVRLVTWFAVGLIVASVIIYLAVAGLYKIFEHQHPSPDAPSRIALQPHTIAPQPQLQTNPAVDLQQFQTAEEAKLNSYGWVDKPAGVIRIPIERAMDLIVRRGLPTRGPGTQDASNKTAIQMQQDKAAATKP